MERTTGEQRSSLDVADALTILEKLNQTELLLVRGELERMRRNKGCTEGNGRQDLQSATPGRVLLGTKIPRREVLGVDCTTSRRTFFGNPTLTVVGFKPTYKNQVVLQDPSGGPMLLPYSLVAKALSVLPPQENNPRNWIPSCDEALEFIRHADGSTLSILLDEIREARKGLDVHAAAQLKVGDIVVCDIPDGPQLEGEITRISACRVTVQMPGSLPNFICVPASMVRFVRAGLSRTKRGCTDTD